MRIDRLVSVNLVDKMLSRKNRPELVILMYHSISLQLDEVRHPYFSIVTEPRRFTEQMFYLFRNNYRVLSMRDALTEMDKGNRNGQPLVVLTFDDGYQDFLESAFPVLQRFQFGASVYLPTDFIANRRKEFNERPCLTWEEINHLQQFGIEFGSHSSSHREMAKLAEQDLQKEIVDSTEKITEMTGEKPATFSFPYAYPEHNSAFSHLANEILTANGYRAAVTTRIGTVRSGNDAFRLPRIPVNQYDDSELFAAKLRGSYDWLYHPQKLSKQIKG
jgi:peptidoglycan/xylan/chitin deacetylase (PgdA/CDA1 family)